MMAVIIFNMVVLMTETDNQSPLKEEVLHYIHFVLILIFTIEFILKMIGLRKYYFTVGLNVLDFFVLFLSIVGKCKQSFKCINKIDREFVDDN